ncbi:uncharacterized protein Tco025E_08970, partial [Trypanosoma conorhini]
EVAVHVLKDKKELILLSHHLAHLDDVWVSVNAPHHRHLGQLHTLLPGVVLLLHLFNRHELSRLFMQRLHDAAEGPIAQLIKNLVIFHFHTDTRTQKSYTCLLLASQEMRNTVLYTNRRCMQISVCLYTNIYRRAYARHVLGKRPRCAAFALSPSVGSSLVDGRHTHEAARDAASRAEWKRE